MPAFPRAIEREAADGLDLLLTLERSWFEVRRRVAGRRKGSHIVGVVDLLAAAPALSATSFAGILGLHVKNAIRLRDELEAADIAVEVMHRSKRRLFGLKDMTPPRDVVQPPYRSEPGRGRPPIPTVDDEIAGPPVPLPPLTPVERRAFDYTVREEAMAHLDAVVRQARHNLGAILRPGVK